MQIKMKVSKNGIKEERLVDRVEHTSSNPIIWRSWQRPMIAHPRLFTGERCTHTVGGDCIIYEVPNDCIIYEVPNDCEN